MSAATEKALREIADLAPTTAEEPPADCVDGSCKRCRRCYSEYVAAKMNEELDDEAVSPPASEEPSWAT